MLSSMSENPPGDLDVETCCKHGLSLEDKRSTPAPSGFRKTSAWQHDLWVLFLSTCGGVGGQFTLD